MFNAVKLKYGYGIKMSMKNLILIILIKYSHIKSIKILWRLDLNLSFIS